jgi:hypothetical protein
LSAHFNGESKAEKIPDDEYRSEISPAKKSRRIHQILRPFISDI